MYRAHQWKLEERAIQFVPGYHRSSRINDRLSITKTPDLNQNQ